MSEETVARNYTPKKPDTDPTPRPGTVLGSMIYRGYEIIHTNDPRLVGDKNCAGFNITSGFIVRDDMGDTVLPNLLAWFYTPFDAIAAIQIMDMLPDLQDGGRWPTTILYEYNKQYAQRRDFVMAFHTFHKIKKLCAQSVEFDENPRDEIGQLIHAFEQHAWSATGY